MSYSAFLRLRSVKLFQIYAQLDEPDGVAGTMALRNVEPSIEDRILALEVSGKLADAAACYERIKPPLKLRHIQVLYHFIHFKETFQIYRMMEIFLCRD